MSTRLILQPGRSRHRLSTTLGTASLYLYDNALTGPIPAALGRLSNLERLYLFENALSGAVPDELGRLSKLERRDLAYNWGLSGPLPPDLRLPGLEVLDLLVTGTCAPAAWEDRLGEITFTGRRCESETDPTIDVAVVYTRGAREAAGGAAAIEAEIDLLIAETNQAYAASGVRHRVALVERSEVSYAGTGDGRVDILRLADPSDDHLDEVHDLRDRVGADLVHLIVAEAADICGIALRPGPFSLTPHGCGSRSFAHELGHNMGLEHDRYQVHHREGGVSAHPAYGYVNQRGVTAGARRSTRWLTIMAYRRQCSDVYAGCSLLLRFSNPGQSYNGDPLGIPFGRAGVSGPSDAVAVLNSTGPAVAAWRDSVSRGPNRPPATVGTLPDQRLALNATLDVDVSQSFVNPDGDALSYTVSSSAPDVVTARASGARVTLTAVGAGAAAIRVTAADPGGLTATQSFVVAVGANRPPPAVATLRTCGCRILGGTLDVDVSQAFDDPDGDALTYAAASSAPEVATASAVGSRVIVAAVGLGRAEIEVTATDLGGLSATQSFGVRVTAPFTDDPIRTGETPIKAVHFMELRTRIDVLRSEVGLGPVRLDRSGPDGRGDAGPARAPARAAAGARRGVRGGRSGGSDLDRPGAGAGDDSDPGDASDGAARRGDGAGVR